MKKKVLTAAAFFTAAIMLITLYIIINTDRNDPDDVRPEQIVAVNEIEELYDSGETELARQKADELAASLRDSSPDSSDHSTALVMCGVSVGFMLAVLCYVYFAVLRPFEKLEGFAEKIAAGNFEEDLRFERSDYFGKFTWAFDSMRCEITKARACEREAIENNKTVIATLSHDIKTPVASIRAYAEGLEANMDTTPEKRQRYLSVIMRKCDEVAKLTNDLFLHSLSDLDKLQLQPEDIDLTAFIRDAANELGAEQGDITLSVPDTEIIISADKNRLMQICENLINNSRKYAKTDISLTVVHSDNDVSLVFRDGGSGIPDEDMPFIFEKFYRGKNCGTEQGSGLGLYIVKYLTEKQGGRIMLRNMQDGFEAAVTLPLKKTDFLRTS